MEMEADDWRWRNEDGELVRLRRILYKATVHLLGANIVWSLMGQITPRLQLLWSKRNTRVLSLGLISRSK